MSGCFFQQVLQKYLSWFYLSTFLKLTLTFSLETICWSHVISIARKKNTWKSKTWGKKVAIKNASKYLEETLMALLNSMPLAQANDK